MLMQNWSPVGHVVLPWLATSSWNDGSAEAHTRANAAKAMAVERLVIVMVLLWCVCGGTRSSRAGPFCSEDINSEHGDDDENS